ncbi:dCTP deaminase domain-containing protein [Rubellimicrobium arenae]|uniref:dCTP deaminase domain-containing protein n=1 Tax=Rubellimicrobium arenae TaxID=2817372 RepID=UPI001B310C9D|nr:hypothetical protein [Rubellimicrobium arenae]
MLVVESQVEERGLVSPASQIQTKNSTCDLTVGRIFPAGPDSVEWSNDSDEIWLKPSHMVSVVTSQRLSLPADVTGLATLVTSLTQEGILCLNVGVVDPGYDGPLGATLVNFSNKERRIYVGQRLFRVLFIQHSPIKKLEPFVQHPTTYGYKVAQRSRNQFSETFLDVKSLRRAAEDHAWRVVLGSIMRNWVPLLAIILAAFAWLAPRSPQTGNAISPPAVQSD